MQALAAALRAPAARAKRFGSAKQSFDNRHIARQLQWQRPGARMSS